MQSIAFVLLLVAAAHAQDCLNCDGLAVREDRMSCRSFCSLDVDGNGIATTAEFLDVFTNVWGCPQTGCNVAQWTAAVQPGMQMCDSEATAFFNRLSIADSSSDPLKIEESDMVAWHSNILFIAGASILDYPAFQAYYAVLYPDVVDPTCPTGF